MVKQVRSTCYDQTVGRVVYPRCGLHSFSLTRQRHNTLFMTAGATYLPEVDTVSVLR